MFYIKEGVQLTASKTVLEILYGVHSACESLGVPCTITSGRDGTHDPHSKHYTDEALDFRVRDIKVDLHQPLVETIKKYLGQNFTVLHEGDHIHVQVKRGSPV